MKTWLKPILYVGILAGGSWAINDINIQARSYLSFKIHIASGGEEVELPSEIKLPPWGI